MTLSSISFGTDGVRGTYGQGAITEACFELIGHAFGLALVLQQAGPCQMVLGRDTRPSGPLLQAALSRGLRRAGVLVWDAGVLPTAAVAVLVQRLGAQAGAVISASHNPAADNGVKFFDAQGQKISDELQAQVQAWMTRERPDAVFSGEQKPLPNASGLFTEFLRESFPGLNLRSWRIVVDGAHGAAWHVAPTLLRELGAEVIEMACTPDGEHINARCGAVHPEPLARLVRDTRADLGLAFDGDADRLVVVDATGAVQDGDAILYLLTKARLRHEPVSTVVGTVMSNKGLEDALVALGVELLRTPVGDKHLAQALQSRSLVLGAESSGHVLVYDKLKTGDGLLAALAVLQAMAQTQEPFHLLTRELKKMPQVTLSVRLSEAQRSGWRWQDEPGWHAALEQVQGWLNGQGRLLVRASGTEPVIRVMVEAREQASAQACAEALVHWLKSHAPASSDLREA